MERPLLFSFFFTLFIIACGAGIYKEILYSFPIILISLSRSISYIFPGTAGTRVIPSDFRGFTHKRNLLRLLPVIPIPRLRILDVSR